MGEACSRWGGMRCDISSHITLFCVAWLGADFGVGGGREPAFPCNAPLPPSAGSLSPPTLGRPLRPPAPGPDLPFGWVPSSSQQTPMLLKKRWH